ncbi:hypothetical protein PITCH_A840026 [uncultured Desulfobacterium sp.]|uniref:Uncharacterized protein n=1 Tax=uncultured Desulfobacterium sp. TaxID=201089 RepID=A0A445N348_9BACT|nr:hypothetical protein PITCH_A840026 [uncultured Desulfobacterium sp.]
MGHQKDSPCPPYGCLKVLMPFGGIGDVIKITHKKSVQEDVSEVLILFPCAYEIVDQTMTGKNSAIKANADSRLIGE